MSGFSSHLLVDLRRPPVTHRFGLRGAPLLISMLKPHPHPNEMVVGDEALGRQFRSEEGMRLGSGDEISALVRRGIRELPVPTHMHPGRATQDSATEPSAAHTERAHRHRPWLGLSASGA